VALHDESLLDGERTLEILRGQLHKVVAGKILIADATATSMKYSSSAARTAARTAARARCRSTR
jgi:hypothetical protein